MASRQTFRQLRASLFWIFCGVALLIIIIPSIDIIVSILKAAIPVIKPDIFTKTTAQGGLQNAILGTVYLGVGVLLTAGTLGVLGGLYIAEFAPARLASVLRFFSEVLSGVPSIVIGYIGYVTLVAKGGLGWHYSLLGGVLALGALILPYIVKTTEVAFSGVPRTLREGATALGMSRVQTIRKVLLPPALPGIISGLIIALAISTGETAPLLFTAGFSDLNPSASLINSPVGYLTGVTYNDLQLPGGNYQALANAAAGVTIVIILLLIFGGRLVTARSRRLVARMDL
ncbi:MAG: phosphate ABC transporter permease PstA [Candidatus Dormibacteraeota bacterium]|nr:phosphate ABC transporter permease PstA [Candidatus Dormibacteraeota bacterium]